ncbi:AMP-binding protein [Pseudoalteromonas nigrifaciens]|uniref:AMP-binding protein n=1 Tax=Pseudoalteromonas nigrifaciens TaxID=28109 RepID=UPI0017887628|nr:AMP-binding protein [Pseudoalteromonas nigrifaciens]MBE0420549.1 AMP-binding protein [Pseudoalteromonas nigrifaciens]
MTVAENNLFVNDTPCRYNLIADLLVRHADDGASSTPALYFENQIISYGELYKSVGIARALLIKKGAQRGDRIALVLNDTPAYIYIFLAAISLGAIPVGINPNENSSQLPEMLKHVGAGYIVVSAENQSYHQLLAESNITAVIIEIDPLFSAESELLANVTSPCRDYEVTDANDILYLTFSSGTTGKAKAVIRRHYDILVCAKSVNEGLMGLTPDDRVMTVTKLTFGYSLVGGLMFTLLAGAALIVIEEKMTAERTIEAALQYKPTILLAQPRIIAEFNRLIETDSYWFTSLRMMMSAGDVLSESVRERWLKLTSITITEGFGSVEVGHFFIAGNGEGMPKGALGRVLNGYEVRLIDENNQEVDEGRQGRLCVRGDSITTGYWNDPKRTRAAFEDDWYFSDDVFSRSDGYYIYAGRLDHMIKTGCGEWVSPVLLENVIRKDDQVADCMVIEDLDENGVTQIKACIVAVHPNQCDKLKTQIHQCIKRQWPRLDHMRVHQITFVDSIPRSANGKIMRQASII